MAKPWHKDFNLLKKSFNKIPVWVRLLNLPLHLWLDFVLEFMEDVIRDFQMVNTETSNILHSMFTCILLEMDVSKGLSK